MKARSTAIVRPLPARLGAAIAVAVCMASSAPAADAPGVIEELRDNGAVATALGERSGLQGWLVERVGEAPYTVYVTQDGHAVLGLLYAPDGSLLSDRQIDAALRRGAVGSAAGDTGKEGRMASPATREADLVDRAAAAFGFTLGARGPRVAVFADPECGFSRAAVAKLGERALDGGLRLRVVPVALLGAAAARRAAGIAASPEPALAWFDDAFPPTAAGAERIAANNALFDAAGGTGTPLVVWRTANGVARQEGAPADVDGLLAEIAR